MKRKYRFYDTGRLWTFRHYSTLDEWLRFKDDILLVKRYLPPNLSSFGIKLQPKRRHRRYFISCRLPKLVGNRVVYRLFKATVWYKAPNTKYRREEKYYPEEAYRE